MRRRLFEACEESLRGFEKDLRYSSAGESMREFDKRVCRRGRGVYEEGSRRGAGGKSAEDVGLLCEIFFFFL